MKRSYHEIATAYGLAMAVLLILKLSLRTHVKQIRLDFDLLQLVIFEENIAEFGVEPLLIFNSIDPVHGEINEK